MIPLEVAIAMITNSKNMENNINKKLLVNIEKRVSRPTSNGMKKINKIIGIMFLFSFIFYFSPFFVGANTTVWYYTGGPGGFAPAKFGPFTTKPECEVSLLEYKKTWTGKTTPCESESSFSPLEVAKPTMEVTLFSEQIGPNFTAWVFTIKTTNLSDGVVVSGAVYDTADSTIIIDRNTAIINNNSATYTTRALMKNNKEYMLVLNATNDKIISTNVWFTKTVGKEGSTTTTKEIDLTSTPVLVAPKTNTATNSDVYNLLAPIGGMDTAPDNMGDYFNKIFLIAIGLCGALAVVMLIIGGIQYMGEDSVFGKTKAKEQITSAVVGLLIALCAYALLNTINPALLGGKINIKSVTIDITEPPILSDAGTTIPTGAKNSFVNCPGGVRSVQVAAKDKIGTIIFCSAYASMLQKMFMAAHINKIYLSGGAFRTYEKQVAARNSYCPEPKLTVAASSCTPPTAIPGTSNHERGLAIDLRCDGSLINFDNQQPKYAKTPATKTCFDWLKKNAITYGFKNLSTENWHWSTGPNAGH